MKLSVRLDSYNILSNSKKMIMDNIKEIELAFHKRDEFFSTDMETLSQKIQENDLIVNSIHGPALKLKKKEEFLKGIKICAELCHKFDCQYFVIHPSYINNRKKTIEFIKSEVTPILEDYNVVIAWENFPGKHRIVNSPSEIAHFVQFELNNPDHHGICFDTAHTVKKTDEVLELMLKYKELIRIYHISNWTTERQHLPLFDLASIDFNVILKRENFNENGAITFEYYYTIDDKKLIEDYSIARKRLFGEN